MTEQAGRELARAREELGAADTLIDSQYTAPALSRTYYAVFHAAVAALLVLGETRSKHSGVVAAFGQLVVHKGGFDPGVARCLRDLFEERNDVDYGLQKPTPEEARERLAQATRFVTEVERWTERRAAPE
jgi:uncharacterized protein